MPRVPRPRCPFIETPCEECYVTRLDSRAIERAIFYCGGDYLKCETYGRLAAARRGEDSRLREGAPDSADPRPARPVPVGRKNS